MPSGREIADALATALGGSVRALATASRSDEFDRLVMLADGRVPLLVRDFGHTLGVCLVGERGWHDRPANFDDASVREIVAATHAWSTAESLTRATMFECAAVLVESLGAHTGGPWLVSSPGVEVPRELWLHPCEGSASVGVFADAVRVWNGSVSLERVLVLRAELGPTSASLRSIAAAVDQQLATHARHIELAVRIEGVAERLIAGLEPRLGACVRFRTGAVSHWATIRMSLAFARKGEVRMFVKEGRVIVEAGLVGEQGFSNASEAVDDVDEMIDPIVAALELEQRTLTIYSLTVGCEYRVRADLQELRAGMIVRFDGFDDIDNHYGRYLFTSSDGVSVAVSGDFSTPRNSPLGEAHRYLEAIG